jgi:HAD superfamily hydrolase (TIGR01509 family)
MAHPDRPDRRPTTAGPNPGDRDPAARPPGGPALDAVLLDFHGTLAQVEDPVAWVRAAAAACGVAVDDARTAALADRLLLAGRAGGPLPGHVPSELLEDWTGRDLRVASHRAAYTGLARTVDSGIEGLADALYDRLLGPDGWVVYADTVEVLRALRAAGTPVALVSNIGFDLRPHLTTWGLDGLLDAVVLSYEVGLTKPDPGIFRHACGLLGVEPRRTLMVGDTPADAGATAAGCTTLVLPAAGPGESNGLGAVLALTGAR